MQSVDSLYIGFYCNYEINLGTVVDNFKLQRFKSESNSDHVFKRYLKKGSAIANP